MILRTVRDEVILRRLHELAARERAATAELLDYLAEAEERNLHLAEGYDSMRSFCMGALHMSEDEAARRVHAAHVARQFPSLLVALAAGRVHLSAIGLIASSLTPANAEGLIAAVAHRSNAEVRELLVSWFPQPEPLRLDDGLTPQVVVPQRPDVDGRGPDHVQVARPTRTRIEPISAERHRLDLSIRRETHDKLRRVQALLGHAIPSGKLEDVLDRALDLALAQLEKKRFGKGAKARNTTKPATGRTIPAHVRRAVYERDGGRCAFIGSTGHRCGSTKQIEIDHIVPIALGGNSAVANLRLVCRIHNQYAADQAFGREFMDGRRGAAREALSSVARKAARAEPVRPDPPA